MALTQVSAHIEAIETYLFMNGARLSKRTISAYGRELRAAKAHQMMLAGPLTAQEAAMSDNDLLAALTA